MCLLVLLILASVYNLIMKKLGRNIESTQTSSQPLRYNMIQHIEISVANAFEDNAEVPDVSKRVVRRVPLVMG